MKKINETKMLNVKANGKGRTCMILGGLAFTLVLAAPFLGWGLLGSGGTITGGGALAGCFD